MTDSEKEIADLMREAQARRARHPHGAEGYRDREIWARIGLVLGLLVILCLLAVGLVGCGSVVVGDPAVRPDAGGAALETVAEVAADAITKSAAPDATVDAGGAGGSDAGGGRVDVPRPPRPCAPYAAPAVALISYACPGSAVVTCDLDDRTGVIIGAAVGCTTDAGALCVMACP